MKIIGFFVLAFLAVAFLSAVTRPQHHREYKPTAGDAIHRTAEESLKAFTVTRDYVLDTPGDLARLKAENDAALRKLCKAGTIDAEDCPPN